MTNSNNESCSARPNKNNFEMGPSAEARPLNGDQSSTESNSPTRSRKCCAFLGKLPSAIALIFGMTIYGVVGYGIAKLMITPLKIGKTSTFLEEFSRGFPYAIGLIFFSTIFGRIGYELAKLTKDSTESTSPSRLDRCSKVIKKLPPWAKSTIGLIFVLTILGRIVYMTAILIMSYLEMPEKDRSCSDANFCEDYFKNQGWWFWSQVVAWSTTFLEFVIWFCYKKEMMHIEMTPDSRMGYSHNLFIKYIEPFWEWPIKWFCKLVCCESEKEDFDRRLDRLPDDAGDGDIYREQEIILRENKSAWMEMFTFSFLGLALELGQRILDIPYFSGPRAFFGDCDGLKDAMLVTKPVYFYIIFVVVEILGFVLYFLGMSVIGDLVEKKNFRRSDIMYVILFSSLEIPVMMILEYFFHERFLFSDSLADNTLVLINNIFTLVFVLSLFSLAVDFIYSNVRPNQFLDDDEQGLVFADGKLNVLELMLFISSMLLVVASIIRLIVNTMGTCEIKFDSLEVGNSTCDMDSNNTTNTICKEFELFEHFEKFTWFDWIYLVSTIFPVAYVVLFALIVGADLIVFLCTDVDDYFSDRTLSFELYNGEKKKWFWQVGFYDESGGPTNSISDYRVHPLKYRRTV